VLLWFVSEDFFLRCCIVASPSLFCEVMPVQAGLKKILLLYSTGPAKPILYFFVRTGGYKINNARVKINILFIILTVEQK
jgi:hypothetical protein